MAEQNQQNKNEEKDLNQLLKVRREKLKDLQDNGKDPFQITKFDVRITLSRWMAKRLRSQDV